LSAATIGPEIAPQWITVSTQQSGHGRLVRQVCGLKARALRNICITHVGRDQHLLANCKPTGDGCADKACRASN